MRTQFIEVTNEDGGGINYGKFMVAQFIAFEWIRPSKISADAGLELPLLQYCGWGKDELIVFDLQTGEGARFTPQKQKGDHRPGSYQLNEKHQIWVCPMFEPFLNWLFEQDLSADAPDLPIMVKFTENEAPSALFGYRHNNVSQGGKYGIHRREVKAGIFYATKLRGKSEGTYIHGARTDDYRALCGKMVRTPTPDSPQFDPADPLSCKSCIKAVSKVKVGQ